MSHLQSRIKQYHCTTCCHGQIVEAGDGHFRIPNTEGSESQTIRNSFRGINRVYGFDFIEKSIILLQTVIVCHASINNAPITATHRPFFICVGMRDAAHSHVLPSIFVFQSHQLHLEVLQYRYILTKCCCKVIFFHCYCRLAAELTAQMAEWLKRPPREL